jgi:Tfp pilus assembly PilM family ATPase
MSPSETLERELRAAKPAAPAGLRERVRTIAAQEPQREPFLRRLSLRRFVLVATPATVVVALGHDRSTLAISDGTVCEFTRVLEWGGEKLEQAIGFDLRVTPEEALELKLHASMERVDVGTEDAQSRAVRDALERELQKLARELVASLQFYQSQPGSLAISEILVAGGTSQIPGLPEELERLTRVRVRRADPLSHVTAPGEVYARDDLASLAIAIGLGVEA